MANILPKEKQVAIVGTLAECMSIRAIERLTGIHRDTIMRLGVRVGEGCAKLLDQKMRNLNSTEIQVDEVWGFIGKKQVNASLSERSKGLGDVWTFLSIDADSKIIPNFVVGRRDLYHSTIFMEDLSKPHPAI
jgi:hypothetical protein